MNILLINHYAGSKKYGMEYRPYYMAYEWVKQGHNVTIVASSYSHLRSINPDVKSDMQVENIDGINYVWFKTPQYGDNGIKRVINIFTFVYKMYKNTKYFVRIKPDVVIASSTYTFDNYVAYRIAKRANAKYIYEVHDLWPLSPVELGGMSTKHPFIVMLQKAEDFAYKHVDAVVSLLPNAYSHMAEHGLDKNKFYCIPNGIKKSEWDLDHNDLSNPKDLSDLNKDLTDLNNLPTEHQNAIAALREHTDFIVGYAGGHGISNALDPFIEAAVEMKNTKIGFVLVGKGPEKDRLMQKAKYNPNIIFLPPVSKNQMPQLLKLFDILYIGFKKIHLYSYGVCPNKLFDYMMSSRPVLFSGDVPKNMVSESGAGLCVGAEDKDAIKNAIYRFKDMSIDEMNVMGEKGRQYVLKNNEYSILSQRFIDIMKSL